MRERRQIREAEEISNSDQSRCQRMWVTKCILCERTIGCSASREQRQDLVPKMFIVGENQFHSSLKVHYVVLGFEIVIRRERSPLTDFFNA